MKLFLFNLENFFLDELSTPMGMKKPEDKILKIASIIKTEDPDILMLLEIGGVNSLHQFNQQYLQSAYHVFISPGNSDRGIEMGYLVKKTINLEGKLLSHVNRVITNPDSKVFGNVKLKFSRDIAELRLFNENELQCLIMLVHLKSKWDREGNDPGGVLRRKSELNSLVDLYCEYQATHPHIPIIICGDFNGVAQKNNCESEFSAIYNKTELNDALDLLQILPEERFTYFQFSREGKRIGHQIDYIFLSQILQNKIIKENSGVYRYKNDNGSLLPLPHSTYERASLPSDHYPLIIDLDFFK